jgi:hypothetical protein
MKMKLSEVMICILCISMFAGCSIKEDRSVCPCRLVLDFSDVDTLAVRAADLMVASSDGLVFKDSVDIATVEKEYVADVPHGELRINVWSGTEGFHDDSEGIVIPFGHGCPPVFMHSSSVDAVGEICREKVVMHKNYCGLSIEVRGRDEVPYSLTVRGNVCGYGTDGSPVEGAFSCVAYPDGAGKTKVSLPRQRDNSLLLDIDDGSGIMKTFALGEYIAASGYDWTAPDLEDLGIVIDYFATVLTIQVRWWDKEYEFDIVL